MVYRFFEEAYRTNKKLFIVLVDPQVVNDTPGLLEQYTKAFRKTAPSMIFVGGSLVFDSVAHITEVIKSICDVPVVLFPGHVSQITPLADAILFLSLISGRNPEFLIGQHVVAAPVLKNARIEVIPTGYILVDGGTATSVEYISHTKPVPRYKADILKATALAGQMLGHKLIYIEGGSGAENVLSSNILKQVVDYIDIPVIVGGGVTTPSQAVELFNAGASGVVVGSALEKEPSRLSDFLETLNDFL